MEYSSTTPIAITVILVLVADEQYVVAKGEMDDGSIATTINQVRGEARVHEIARMLSGSESEASLEHAEELLKSSVLD